MRGWKKGLKARFGGSMTGMLALKQWRQEDQEFKVSLGYVNLVSK